MKVTFTHKDDNGRTTATLLRDDGRQVLFEVKNYEIRILKNHSKKRPKLSSLSEEERLAVFRLILAQYRPSSHGDGGYKGAAIGITEDDRIFIGLNTKRQVSYFKDCAEQNMLNNVTDAISTDAMKEKQLLPDELPKLKALYMMGGKEPEPGKKDLKISCPCGKCVDMLSNSMTSDAAPIYSLGIIPEKNIPTVIEGFDFTIKTAADSATVQGIRPEHEIWRVPIAYLNNHRELGLTKNVAKTYVNGVKTLMGSLNAMQPELPFEDDTRKAVMRLVKNAANVKTIHDLELEAKGESKLTRINDFMRGRIDDAMESRWRAFNNEHPDADKDEFLKKIDVTRCVVIQMTDGSFRYGMDVESDFDNAMPNAEVTAVANAVDISAEHRVQDVWVMELRPSDVERIESGQQKPIMHTSAKEGLERINKRGLSDTRFHYIPYNDGTMKGEKLDDRAIEKSLMRSFSSQSIFPSNFNGVKFLNRDVEASSQAGRAV